LVIGGKKVTVENVIGFLHRLGTEEAELRDESVPEGLE
jgi:hypothetical protein